MTDPSATPASTPTAEEPKQTPEEQKTTIDPNNNKTIEPNNNNTNSLLPPTSNKPISGPAAGAKNKEKGKEKDGKKRDKEDKEEQKKKPVMITTEPVKGTRDFPPDDMRVRNWLFGQWREVGRLFGFQEYDAPVLEHEELYTRKAGEEITQQMYNFIDKAGRPVALRPELTPSLARILLKLGSQVVFPVKWFSIPQCWRFEQTVRGRKREHYQWNMDIIGVPNIAAEAELLAAIVTFFKRVGFTSDTITIRINSRKVLQCVLDKLQVTGEKFIPTCIVIDKLDKLTEQEVFTQLGEIGLPKEAIVGILESTKVKSLDELGARLGVESEAYKELYDLFAMATAYGYRDWIQFDASVIRGLSYYTGIVFEGIDKTGGITRAICGGGRYDRLFEMFGASKKEQQPCCGFGFDKKLLPKELERPSVNDVIALYSDALMPAAMEVATILRNKGRSVDLILNKKKNLAWAYSYADRLGAERVVLIAPSEWEKKSVNIKFMRKGKDDAQKEAIVKIEDL